MGKVVIAGLPTPGDLVRLNSMIDALKFKGPNLDLHILAGDPGQVVILAWGKEGAKTETPTFSSSGSVDQAFGALKDWFAREGWLAS